MDGSAVSAPGSASGARRSTGRIPISILIEPTDATEAESQQTPTYTPAVSSATSSPTFHQPRRTSLSMAYLTNPVMAGGVMNARSTGQKLPNHDGSASSSSGGDGGGGGASPASLQRYDSAWSNSDSTRNPRPPRPSYSEEQKFFIMFARIMKDHSWPEIEDHFAEIFGQRSKGGLTSVYYRVRKDWGLMEVLKSGPSSFAADCREVERRALNFSAEYLSQIGYIDR